MTKWQRANGLRELAKYMFTGIISQTSEVKSTKKVPAGLVVTFKKPRQWTDLVLSESVSVNGVCLTVQGLNSNSFSCSLIPETLKKTTFGELIPSIVNLERATKVGDRFGGHFVQGHIDCTGEVLSIKNSGESQITIEFPAKFINFVVDKGSITVNGVALTISKAEKNRLSVALIPYTLQHTNLGNLKVGDRVNLEFDMLGKYAAKAL